MDNHILVNKGALQMLFNVLERKAKEEGKPILQEIVDEVKVSCISHVYSSNFTRAISIILSFFPLRPVVSKSSATNIVTF